MDVGVTSPRKDEVESRLEQRPRAMQGAIAEAALGHPCPTRHLSIHGLQDSHNLIDIEGLNPFSTRQIKKAPNGAFLICVAEREGFDPSIRDYRIHTFQACSFNHSDTSPDNLLIFNELAVRKARDSITISRKFTESDMEIF